MASLMENLLDTLEKENTEYEKLVELSKDKTQIIVSGDIAKLNEITEKEREIVDVIANLEKTRVEVINDMGIVLNKDVEALNIKDLIKLLDKQPQDQKKLSVVHDKLKVTLGNMKTLNDHNKMLLEHSMEMLEFEMTLYQNSNKAPETANYGKDAYSTGDLLINTSGFDTKR